jgi:hypothetical protein
MPRAYIYMQKGVQSGAFVTVSAGDKIADALSNFAAQAPFNKYKLLRGYDEGIPQQINQNSVYEREDGELRIYLQVNDIKLYHAHGKKARYLPEIVFALDSYNGLAAFKKNIHDGICADKARKASTEPSLVSVRPFQLVHYVGKEMVVLTEANVLERVATDKKVFIDFLQPSYSRTTNSILDKFSWPEGLDTSEPKAFYNVLMSNHHNTKSAETAADDFITMLKENAKANEQGRKEWDRWNACTASATKALNEWSIAIPVLESYNEATRRLLINEVILQVCIFLGKTMLVEAYQCVNQAHPPSHFQGTGTLDYLLGVGLRTCIETYPRDVHLPGPSASSAEEEEGEQSGLVSGEPGAQGEDPSVVVSVELQTGDPLSVVLSPSTDVEAKERITLAALLQLLAQIHDKVYVSTDDVLLIANHCIAFEAEEGPEPVLRKRKVEVQETAERKFRQLTGILTTGHTWQVFQFTFNEEEMQDPAARMKVEYAGSFSVPILQYAGPAAQGRTGSGAEAGLRVKGEDVAKLMAMLVVTNLEPSSATAGMKVGGR